MINYVLITGVTSGLGKALVSLYLKDGWHVIGIGRNQSKLDHCKIEFGAMFMPYLCDVSIENNIQQVCDTLKEKNIIPNVLILNAGDGSIEMDTIDIQLHRHTFEVNYFGVIKWVSEFLKVQDRRDRTFVIISSILDKFPTPFAAAYCASKSAIAAAAHSLQAQYLNSSNKFVRVFPGPINTPMFKSDSSVPFVMEANIAARYLFKQIRLGKTNIVFPKFYKMLFSLLKILPLRLSLKLLNHRSK